MVQVVDVKVNADLLSVVSRDTTLTKVADTGGGEFAGPCPLCKDGDDRFRVQRCAPPGKKPSGPRWMCRHCSPKWSDVIGYVQKRHNLDFQPALEYLADMFNIPEHIEIPTKTDNPDQFDRAEWEKISIDFLKECVQHLWAPEGEKALTYLHKRGLNDDTIATWRIGFNPDEGTYTPSGIVIPCWDAAGLHYLKVRQSRGSPKYKIIKGGEQWPFGLQTYRNTLIGFLFESELDALLGWQTGLHGVGFAALPAGQRIHAEYLPYFYDVADFIVAYDNDDAGHTNAEVLCRIPGFHLADPVPSGKDLTEYGQQGGDILEYLLAQVGLLK